MSSITEYDQKRFLERIKSIYSIDSYLSGDKVHHSRSTWIDSLDVLNSFFGYDIIDSKLVSYVQGRIEIALLMEKNYRPGVHLAILLFHSRPHRQFHDGHVVQIEFGEGSHTHQIIEKLFDIQTCATVVQMSEYDILEYLADDNDMYDLLYGVFMQDFNPMRFGINQNEYFIDPTIGNIHQEHDCCDNEINHHIIQIEKQSKTSVTENPIADYYAGLNLQIHHSEPNISSYWNMNLNCLNQKN